MDTKGRLLVVDNEPEIVFCLKKLLEQGAYSVETAVSGENALALLRQKSFDILITDFRMPGMNGIELIGRALQLQPDLQCMILTGHGDMDTVIETMKLGAVNYLRKPVNIEEMRIAVERGMEKLRLIREVRESEERYRAVFEQAADSIVMIDPRSGALAEFNDQTHENLGYTREEFEKLKLVDIDVIESPEEVAKHVEKTINKGSDIFETQMRTKHNEIRDVLVSAKSISLHGKKFIASIWKDITDRKRMEKALQTAHAELELRVEERTVELKKANDQLQREISEHEQTGIALQRAKEFSEIVLNSMNDAISLIDVRDFRVADCNNIFLDEYTLTEEEVIGKFCYELTHHRSGPCGSPHHRCPLRETVATGGHAEALHVHFTKNGERKFVEISTAPIRDEEGVIIQVVHVARDVTERKRAEDVIKFQVRLEKLINSISTNLLNLPTNEIDDGINYALKAICRFNQVDRCYMLQFSNNETALKHIHEWCAEWMEPRTDERQDLSVAELPWWMKKMRRFETIIVPNVNDLPAEANAEKDFFGARAIKSLLAVPMVYNGTLKGFIGFESVRERKVWGQECIDMLKIVAEILINAIERGRAAGAMRESLKEKEVLLREIHHRVKNNMQVVSSLLDLQSEYVKDKKYIEMFKESRNRIKSMALIHEKLYRAEDLANIELGDYVNELADSLITSYGTDADRIVMRVAVENISLKIDTAIPCGLIMNELISNALKHAFPENRKGEIRITLHSPGENELELAVHDNGIGLPNDLDFRSTDSLGLQLVVSLAEHQLQGKVKLNREHGTEFRIRFRQR